MDLSLVPQSYLDHFCTLVFVAHSTFVDPTDLKTRLELIKHSDLSRVRAFYGVVAIMLFAGKLFTDVSLADFFEAHKGTSALAFLALYIAPGEIPKWQIAEIANSMLAVGGMLFTRHALLLYKLDHPWPETPVKRILGFVGVVRWLLAIYTILCTAYITWNAAKGWRWPNLGEKWLPWL
jgi:hypothetical protein